MSKPAQHTPTPWTADEYESRDDQGRYMTSQICDANGLVIVEFSNSSVAEIHHEDHRWDAKAKANAAFIVRAVNAHYDLVGALRFILAFYEPGQKALDTEAWKHAEAAGRAALAKAEAE